MSVNGAKYLEVHGVESAPTPYTIERGSNDRKSRPPCPISPRNDKRHPGRTPNTEVPKPRPLAKPLPKRGRPPRGHHASHDTHKVKRLHTERPSEPANGRRPWRNSSRNRHNIQPLPEESNTIYVTSTSYH